MMEKNSNQKMVYIYYYKESIMGSNVPDRLEKIGNSIASHISNVTLERIKIARMVLNFKITDNDTIILL